MQGFNKDIFDGTVKIVASALEETETELSTDGGEKVADFFEALYSRLSKLAENGEKCSAKGSFEIYEDKSGGYGVVLKSENGETIAVSEGHKK